MNEYFTTFLDITTTVEQMLNHEYNSLEIKSSATSLNESVQPCLEELKQSATRLKGLVQVCLDDLDRAEEVWNSKPKIAEKANLEIWEQIGEISGSEIRMSLAGSQCRDEALKEAQEFWDNLIEELKKKWFIDAKGQLKKGVGWNEKTGALNDIRTLVERQSMELTRIVKEKFIFFYKEEQLLESTLKNITFLTEGEGEKWKYRLLKKLENLMLKVFQALERDFKNFIKFRLSNLGKTWGDLLWEDITKFQKVGHEKKKKMKLLIQY